MFLGEILCPDDRYHYRVYINLLSCNDAMVKPVYQMDPETRRPLPGSIGKVIFKSRDCMTTGVIAHEAVHMATSYARIVTKDKLVFGAEIGESEETIAHLVGHFASGLGKMYWGIKIE